jgi:hypothetical protein
MNGLTYLDDRHEYRLNGIWKPGVTRVLADCGFNKGSDFFDEESRVRGQLVHKARFLVDEHAPEAETLEDVLEVMDLGETIQPYVAGWVWFKRETGFKPIGHEQPMCLPDLNVCGTPDVWGLYPSGKLVLIDTKGWKSQGSRPKRAAEIQTAGYKLMLKHSLNLTADLRDIVALPGDGTFRVYRCSNPMDEAIFRACCMIWHDRANNKLIDGLEGPSDRSNSNG